MPSTFYREWYLIVGALRKPAIFPGFKDCGGRLSLRKATMKLTAQVGSMEAGQPKGNYHQENVAWITSYHHTVRIISRW